MDETAVHQDTGGTPSMVVTVRAVILLVTAMSTLVCCTRLYARKFVIKAFGLDDYMVIIALMLVLGFSALSITITFYGIGRHQETVLVEYIPTMQKIVYVSLCTYLFVATAVKSSVTIFVMRVFPQRYIQLSGKAMIAFLIVLTVSGELAFIFQCKPVRAAYDKSLAHYTCYSADTMFGLTMYQGVLMFLADVVIIVLPMPAIWKLQMPMGKRLLVMLMFGFGFLACVAEFVRLPTLVYAKDETDYTYSAANSLIWMNVEFNIGLLVGSLSAIYQLLKTTTILSRLSSRGKGTRATGSERTLEGYEFSRGSRWRGTRILMTKEVTTVVETQNNESQERIVPDPSWGREGHTMTGCSSST